MFSRCLSLSLPGCSETRQRHPEESEARGGEEEAHQGSQEFINCSTFDLIKRFWSKFFIARSYLYQSTHNALNLWLLVKYAYSTGCSAVTCGHFMSE